MTNCLKNLTGFFLTLVWSPCLPFTVVLCRHSLTVSFYFVEGLHELLLAVLVVVNTLIGDAPLLLHSGLHLHFLDAPLPPPLSWWVKFGKCFLAALVHFVCVGC